MNVKPNFTAGTPQVSRATYAQPCLHLASVSRFHRIVAIMAITAVIVRGATGL